MGAIERLTAAAQQATAGARASLRETELRQEPEAEPAPQARKRRGARASRWGVLPMLRRRSLS